MSIVEDLSTNLEEILALGQGLDDNDYKAELQVQQNDPNSNLFSAVTFEELNLYVTTMACLYFDSPVIISYLSTR